MLAVSHSMGLALFGDMRACVHMCASLNNMNLMYVLIIVAPILFFIQTPYHAASVSILDYILIDSCICSLCHFLCLTWMAEVLFKNLFQMAEYLYVNGVFEREYSENVVGSVTSSWSRG